MQRCIKVPINIKLTVQEDTKVMVISADDGRAQAVRRPRRPIQKFKDESGKVADVEFTLIFDPKDNGGGDIRGTAADKTGVKVPEGVVWKTPVRGFQRKNLNSGVELLFSVNPLTEVLAAVLDGVPGGENWQLKIHTREPFATNGEGQVRLMFVFMHVEPEMEDVVDEDGKILAADGKVDKEKKPWENEPEAQQRVKTAATAVLTSHMDVIKNNIIKYIKSQVGSSVQKASAVDVTVGEVLAATYVEGYAYAPQLAYGPASDHSLGGVGSEWNRMRLEMQLNYPNEEKQLRVLRRMRDALLHEKDEGKFNERGQWTMVAKPSDAYLVFTTGQTHGQVAHRAHPSDRLRLLQFWRHRRGKGRARRQGHRRARRADGARARDRARRARAHRDGDRPRQPHGGHLPVAATLVPRHLLPRGQLAPPEGRRPRNRRELAFRFLSIDSSSDMLHLSRSVSGAAAATAGVAAAAPL